MALGNVANCVSAGTFPATLSSAFSRIDEYVTLRNEYPSGDSQRRSIDASGKARWSLSKRLSASDMATLRAFYFARNGPHEAFEFVDEDSVTWYVRFDTPWEQTLAMGRGEASITLVEVV